MTSNDVIPFTWPPPEHHMSCNVFPLGAMKRLKQGALWHTKREAYHLLFHVMCLIILGPTIGSNPLDNTFLCHRVIQSFPFISLCCGHRPSPTIPSLLRNKFPRFSLCAPLQTSRENVARLSTSHEYLPSNSPNFSCFSA